MLVLALACYDSVSFSLAMLIEAFVLVLDVLVFSFAKEVAMWQEVWNVLTEA